VNGTDAGCLLLHQGTADLSDLQDDLLSLFEPTTVVNGITFNAAFVESYMKHANNQMKALNLAYKFGFCAKVDVAGFSLGAATAAIAAVSLEKYSHSKAHHILMAAPPRAFESDQKCSGFSQHASGTVVRFNRAERLPGVEYDEIGSLPLVFKHCADYHVKLISDSADGGKYEAAFVGGMWPAASLAIMDIGWHDSRKYSDGMFTLAGNESLFGADFVNQAGAWGDLAVDYPFNVSWVVLAYSICILVVIITCCCCCRVHSGPSCWVLMMELFVVDSVLRRDHHHHHSGYNTFH